MIVSNQDARRGTTTAQTELASGSYVGLDTASNGPGPPPFALFTVAANPSPAALPAASATVRAIDFAFRGPSVLHDGSVVRGVNDGYVTHMIDAAGVRSPADGRKVISLLRRGKDRRAFKLTTHTFFSLAEPISHGSLQQAVLNVQRGWYVQVCFETTQDGREHTRLGMERLIR